MEPVAQQRRLTRTGRGCGPSEGEQPSDRKRVLSAMASATAAALWTGPWGFCSGGPAWEPVGNAGPRPRPRPAASPTGAGQRPGLPGATQQHVTAGKIVASTRWTFVGEVMSLLFNMLSRLVREIQLIFVF